MKDDDKERMRKCLAIYSVDNADQTMMFYYLNPVHQHNSILVTLRITQITCKMILMVSLSKLVEAILQNKLGVYSLYNT